MTDSRPLSAIPPVTARALAFGAILIFGFIGGVIGYLLGRIQCDSGCGVRIGVAILLGSVIAAAGTAVVSVLALRAMGEWHEIDDRARAGHAPR